MLKFWTTLDNIIQKYVSEYVGDCSRRPFNIDKKGSWKKHDCKNEKHMSVKNLFNIKGGGGSKILKPENISG